MFSTIRPWLAAIRATATPLLLIAAAVLIGLSSAYIVISAHEVDTRSRIERAADRAERSTADRYETELADVRAELDDVREARDACFAAADAADSPIYGYYADTDDAPARYAGWLPLLDDCRDIAAPAPESTGDGTGFQRHAAAVGGGR